MDDSGYIFNPYQWKKSNLSNLTEEQIANLDDRYINVDENIPSQNVDNLNIINLNLATSGKIYFAHDSTEQTTAYDPDTVTQQINNFLSANNTFTGENTFNKLILKDDTKTSQITESGVNLTIENNNTSGSITLKLKDAGGGLRNVVFDQFGNISGLNDVNCNKLRGTEIRLNSSAYQILNDGDNFALRNNIPDSSIKLITKTSSSTSELTFNSNGDLYVPAQIQSTTMKASTYQFSGDIQIYSLINNLIIDNNTPLSSFKIKNYDGSGNAKTLTIDSNMNMSGLNNISTTQLTLPNLTQTCLNGAYTINNSFNGGSLILQNRDDTGIMKQLTVDKNMNLLGINDLYTQRIYMNSVLLDFTQYDEMKTNTKLIKSTASYNTSIEYNNGRFLFLPNIASTEISRNGILKTGDNALIGYNVGSTNVLALCPWTSATNPVGIRATPTQTELYKPKVMDTLKFADDTIQSTAMTDAYLESKLLSIMTRLNLTTQVPTGTILPYGGNASNPPAGFLGCLGQYVLISTYQNLYNVIGQNYYRGHTTSLPIGYFWLPDFAGGYMKGIGASEIWGTLPGVGGSYVGQNPIFYNGEIQKYNVGKHRHQYTDRGVDSKTVGSGSTTNAIKGSNGTYYTDINTYDVNNVLLDEENRPNSVGVSYIIKF